jgi:hypothetical protein
MAVMMVGIGIINAVSAIKEAGLPRLYPSTGGANVHDSYYTMDLFGFIPIVGTPDYRIGWMMIIAAILIYICVAIWFFSPRTEGRERIDA